MENSGLSDVWVESSVFAENTASAVLEGKQYYRAVRVDVYSHMKH